MTFVSETVLILVFHPAVFRYNPFSFFFAHQVSKAAPATSAKPVPVATSPTAVNLTATSAGREKQSTNEYIVM